MSRANFEEWAKVRGHPFCDVVPKYGPASSMPQSEYRFSDIAYEAWLAGRESMRDEAAILCEGRAVIHYDYLSDECTSPQEISDLESHECAAAIRQIEP